MDEMMPIEQVESKIYLIRGQKVMLDKDLADLYGVATKVVNQAVRRNEKRFPPAFVFQLNHKEKDELVTNCDRFSRLKHSTSLPYAFTEHGVAMLSSVLNSERAIQVNIIIIRTFIHLRHLMSSHKELARQVEALEKKYARHEGEISVVFKLLKKLMEPVKTEAIGFHLPNK